MKCPECNKRTPKDFQCKHCFAVINQSCPSDDIDININIAVEDELREHKPRKFSVRLFSLFMCGVMLVVGLGGMIGVLHALGVFK